MREKSKLIMEKLLVGGVGLFVGQVPIYAIHPLAVAFFVAAYLNQLESGVLFVAILVSVYSKLSLFGLLKYGIILTLAWIFGKPFQKEKLGIAMCIYIGLLVFLVNVILSAWLGVGESVLILPESCLKALIAGVTAYLLKDGVQWKKLLRGREQYGNSALISTGILLGIVLYGIPKTGAFAAISLGVGAFVVLYFSFCYGMGEGAFFGTVCGMVLMYQSGDMKYLGLYAVMGIGAGLIRLYGRIGTVGGMICGTLVSIYGFGVENITLSGVGAFFVAGILFLVLPESFVYSREKELQSGEELMAKQYLFRMKEKAAEFANVYLSMAKGLKDKPKEVARSTEYEAMIGQMKYHLCDDCSLCKCCYEEKKADTYEAAGSIFQALEEKGGIESSDIPVTFANQCMQLEPFMIEANRSFEKRKMQEVFQEKLKEGQVALAAQFHEVGEAMREFSFSFSEKIEEDEEKQEELARLLRRKKVRVRKVVKIIEKEEDILYYVTARALSGKMMTSIELGKWISEAYGVHVTPGKQTPLTVGNKYQVYTFCECKNFRVLKGAYRKAASCESVAGDHFSFLDLENGRTVSMLADGVGTGQEEERESRYLIETMERLLETGISEKQGIRLVNAMMSFSSPKDQFSTLDITSFHRASGNCTFLKMGASTTFIKWNDWVDAISSTTLPVETFDTVKMDVATRKLYPGNMVIMVSDGVMDAISAKDKETFLKEMIRKINARQPEEFTKELVELVYAVGGNQSKDDMSAIAMLVV